MKIFICDYIEEGLFNIYLIKSNENPFFYVTKQYKFNQFKKTKII